jgi:hypothetical protein
MTEAAVDRRLTWAGGLVEAGLGIQLALSGWGHPLAFVAFLTIAGPLVVAGMLLFLWTVVTS